MIPRSGWLPRPISETAPTNEWATPRWLFDAIARRYGPFDLDACATLENRKCSEFFSIEVDGLTGDWYGRVWVNPPYARDQVARWLEKAYNESVRGCHVTCLLPVRTGAEWWRDWVSKASVVEYLSQRVRFIGAKHNAPWDTAVVCFFPPILRP